MLQESGEREVQARIVYWGIPGAGKTASIRTIYAKLRPDRRGVLRERPTRLDPTVTYEELPIELGSIQGVRTQLKIVSVPGSPDQEHTRKQLLDRADGIVLVLDSRSECMEHNVAAVDELRRSLDAYGRSLTEIPVVVQYNKRDLSDPYAIEGLHRRLALTEAAVFETVATEGRGILQCLTTISKRVVRVLRERRLEPEPFVRSGAEAAAIPSPNAIAEPQPAPATVIGSASLTSSMREVSPSPSPRAPVAPLAEPDGIRARALMEEAILSEGSEGVAIEQPIREAETLLDRSFEEVARVAKRADGARIGADLKIVSVGQARATGERSLRLPIVLGNGEGQTVTLALSLKLDPLLDDEGS